MPLMIYSKDWTHRSSIPVRFTADGENVSPELAWTGVPREAKSLALVVDDPDAPRKTFVHWVVADIPPTERGLPSGIAGLPRGAVAGRNDAGTTEWFGPAPPSGKHRYVFKLYALDTVLGLTAPTKAELEAAMKDHVLDEARLIGTYERLARDAA